MSNQLTHDENVLNEFSEGSPSGTAILERPAPEMTIEPSPIESLLDSMELTNKEDGIRILRTAFSDGNAYEIGYARYVVENLMEVEVEEGEQNYVNDWLLTLLADKNKSVVDNTKILVGKRISEFGLPQEVVFKWELSDIKHNPEGIMRNFERLCQLEDLQPGIAEVLYEKFDIVDVARYPVEMMLRQYEQLNVKDKPYGLIIFPESDHNGTFQEIEQVFRHFMTQLEPEYPLRVFEVSDASRIVGAINKARKMFDSSYTDSTKEEKQGIIEFLIVGGHGEPNSIVFGEPDEDDNNKKKKIDITIADISRRGADVISNAFVQFPTVILLSCSTGKLGGIGEVMSKIGELGAHVIAPDQDTVIQGIDVKRNERGRLEFKVDYYYGTNAMSYFRGTVLED